MKSPSSLLLLGLVLPACGQPYFVAPAGNDANPGTLEKPFASLARAQQAVRQKPGSVWLRGGTYYLPEKLVFTAQDSGTKAAPVVYQAYGQRAACYQRRRQAGETGLAALPRWHLSGESA